jgi:hypothetical protein
MLVLVSASGPLAMCCVVISSGIASSAFDGTVGSALDAAVGSTSMPSFSELLPLLVVCDLH